jgi:hypothetical protein
VQRLVQLDDLENVRRAQVCAGGNGICCTGTCVPRTHNGQCR